ncbi:MAG: DUF4159 domain-containing protein [Bacteroidota bacterium]
MRACILTVLLCLGLLTVLPVQAQGYRSYDLPGPEVGYGIDHGFRFVRIQYETVSYRRFPAWAYDFPTAEANLHQAIERTTGLHLEGEPIVLTLLDEAIFDHPFLYLCEPGYWSLQPGEADALRTYLERGGFLLIDDFHDYGDGQLGPEWYNFYAIIKEVFPNRELIDLPPEHPIWSVYYDIDPLSARSTKAMSGEVPWLDEDDDTYLGIFDDNGRLMVLVCYNQDIGDGWEWPGGRNLGDASTVSFQMAINFIMYTMTH